MGAVRAGAVQAGSAARRLAATGFRYAAQSNRNLFPHLLSDRIRRLSRLRDLRGTEYRLGALAAEISLARPSLPQQQLPPIHQLAVIGSFCAIPAFPDPTQRHTGESAAVPAQAASRSYCSFGGVVAEVFAVGLIARSTRRPFSGSLSRPVCV